MAMKEQEQKNMNNPSRSSMDPARARAEQTEQRAVRTGGKQDDFSAGSKAPQSDERLKSQITSLLARDNQLASAGVEFEVRGGKVTLKGWVPSVDLKQKAESTIHDVDGIEHVENQIQVHGHGQPQNYGQPSDGSGLARESEDRSRPQSGIGSDRSRSGAA